MSQVGIQELLEAGVHFGHQTSRWNPNMRRYIAGEIDGIHIIDLLQTEEMLEEARRFVGELTSGGGVVLFVGTKKQASDVIEDWAGKSNMPYVNRRWLPGLLTNFSVSSQRIKRMHEIRGLVESGQIDLLPTKERMNMQAELAKLEFALGGVADMDRVPDAVFITDLKSEEIALNEATRLRLPVIALVDSNCDPGHIDHVIPGNDDAIRSCELVISTIGSAVEQGAGAWAVIEEKRRAEEQARREKEEAERRKREEEERARREQIEKEQAEEKARKREEQAKAEAAAKEAAANPHPQAIQDENPHPQAVPSNPHPQAIQDDNPHPQAVPSNPHPQAIQDENPHPQAVPGNSHPQAIAPDPEPAEATQTEETPAEQNSADESTEEKN